ncbi:MAG TPA: FGGY-family carbohydrate kinase, partial [Candidatus Baltobacteraceae bacterium]|nr:FGGY-family carbohydrate kinase [Candidatus Baltobacteraceae bacterium]
SWLPRVHEGPEVTGMISVKAAHETGLTPATWVVAGAGDNAAAAVGAGVIGNGDALLSVGTSGVIFAHCYSPLVDPTGAIQAFAHAMHRRYHVMGVMLAAGGSLRWCRDTIAAGSDYDQLIAEASRASPGSDGAIFLPYLCGERTPHMNPFARAGWFGLTLAHGRAQIVRSVLEGVAFGLLDSLVRIEELGIRITALRAVGNGLDNPVWRRIVCDVLNRPLSRPVVEEGPAFGAAVLASVGSGIHASVNAAVTEMVHVSEVPDEPNPSTHAIYEASYERFCDMYLALLPFMDEEQACPV